MKPDRTVQTYDRIAPQFSRTHFYPDFWLPEFRIFQKLVPGKTVIDIGCGAGRDAVLFNKAKFNYTGIDASAGMLTQARKRVPKGKFRLMSFYDLKFRPDSFDGFWTAASILHIPKRRVGKVLRSIRGIVKPHGVGFISIKEKVSLDEGLIREEKWGGIERYFAFYTKKELTDVLTKNGFEIFRSYRKRGKATHGANWLCYFVKKIL